jgi:CheY-like chemotaxis protein
MGYYAPHALIVEDNPAELAGLAAFVATEGFRTSRASSLEEARRVLRRSCPDVILCDYLLPDGHGTELVDELGSRIRDVEFVLVTSSVDAPEVRRREHLAKPVDLRTVQRVLDRVRASAGTGAGGEQGGPAGAPGSGGRSTTSSGSPGSSGSSGSSGREARAYPSCSYALSRL